MKKASPMESADRLASAARAFLLWAQAPAPAGEEARDIRRALEILAELYAAALGIPPSAEEDKGGPAAPIDEDVAARLGGRFSALPLQWYSEAADPLEVPAEEISVAELPEDLAGIYAGVEAGLKLHDAGRREEAARAWGSSFSGGWGRRAASAIRAMHEWISENPEHLQ